MKKFALILSTVILAVAFCACGSSSSPKAVVNDYYKALKDGDFEKALTYTTIEDKEIQSQVEKLNGLKFQVYEYEILNEVIDKENNTATVQVKYRYNTILNGTDSTDGEEVVKDIELVKKDGKWKIEA